MSALERLLPVLWQQHEARVEDGYKAPTFTLESSKTLAKQKKVTEAIVALYQGVGTWVLAHDSHYLSECSLALQDQLLSASHREDEKQTFWLHYQPAPWLLTRYFHLVSLNQLQPTKIHITLPGRISKELAEKIEEAIRTNRSLQELYLNCEDWDSDLTVLMLASIRQNETIRQIQLVNSAEEPNPFISVYDRVKHMFAKPFVTYLASAERCNLLLVRRSK